MTVRRMTAPVITVFAVVAACATLVATAAAATPPSQDPFYRYGGSQSLGLMAPGTVLKTRTLSAHVAGVPVPVTAVQLLYRTTTATGRATVNVTSVLLPPVAPGEPSVVSYQSFYDSLNNEDEPSYAISGGLALGGLIPDAESGLIAPALLAGNTVVISDTEGENADFAAGPEYGFNTLDSLRAALNSPATRLAGARRIGLMGYSGGAIATGWAMQLAPSYAPELDSKLVGAAFGGVPVDIDHNLHYIDGTLLWSGGMPLVLIGIARAYHLDLARYMSAYGRELDEKLQHASITEAFGQYRDVTWTSLFTARYPTPESIPAFAKILNKLMMGDPGVATAPLFIVQGAGGELEGTPGNKPGIGPGDGATIAGDVRTLAREYCSGGTKVEYKEAPLLSHFGAGSQWIPEAYVWMTERLSGMPANQDCAEIAPGNSLQPIP